jgi:hypothetical protein
VAPGLDEDRAPVLPPSYGRRAATALHLGALTLVTQVHLLALCRIAVRQALSSVHTRCRPAVQQAGA